jgi:NAD(P)-dependent dehydrogenase (short-subunit alcohol dehydrogenase family)
MNRMTGRVALISGGAQGMGAEHARALAAEGASVAIGDILDEAGTAVAANIGEQAMFVHLDVTDEDSWSAGRQVEDHLTTRKTVGALGDQAHRFFGLQVHQ